MKRGFTLVEILTTIAIFSVLVTITGYVYASALARSRDHQRLSDLQTISNGLEQFYLDHKNYPSVEANPSLFLAKYQLERFDSCLPASHDYLVPTYLVAIPEDPSHKFTLSGLPPNCASADGQKGQYLYIPVIAAANDTVRDFVLAAKVERSNNVSETAPTPNLGYYRSLVSEAGILFCTDIDNSGCTHNYFLSPKKNN